MKHREAQFIITPSWWQQITPIDVGYEACLPGHSFGPSIRKYYLLHFVHSGSGFFKKGGQTYSVGAGDIFVIHPDEVATYRATDDDPWVYTWISFTSPELPFFLKEPVIRKPDPAVEKSFTRIQNMDYDQNTDVGLVFAEIYNILSKLSGGRHISEQSRINDYAAFARSYIETNFDGSVRLSDIAERLFISPKYLTRVFSKVYGISPQEYLIRLRLEHADSLLKHGYSVSDSAYLSGFSDHSNFAKKYKSYYGICPGDRKIKKTPFQESDT